MTLVQSIGWRVAPLVCALWRFGTLRIARHLFQSAPPGTVLRRRLFGFEFVSDVSQDDPQRLIYLEGERFIDERTLIRRLVNEGDHAVDIGANIGYYSLMLARFAGPTGKVTAIEPSVENLSQLRRNVRHNELEDRVRILEFAVGDQSGLIGLRSGINSGVTTAGDAAYQVKQETLERLITEPINFLKMDIEGYEVFAIPGAEAVIQQQRPTIFLEVHPQSIRGLNSPTTITGLVCLLRRHYDDLEVFDPEPRAGPISKFFRLYLGLSHYRKVADIDAFLSAIERSSAPTPFWLVCKAPAARQLKRQIR